MIPINLIAEVIDVLIQETVKDEDFEKSKTEIDTFDLIEDLKYPQQYVSNQAIFFRRRKTIKNQRAMKNRN